MHRKRIFVGAMLVIVLAGIIGVGAISAADREQQRDPRPSLDRLFGWQIVGTWEATVNRGTVLPALTSLHTLTLDGSIVESSTDTLYRSAAFGVWEYIGNRTYATTMVFHRFSPAGTPIGSLTVNANRQVSPDGETYTGVAVNVVRDSAGNVIGGGRATVTARRMHVERIPDLP